MREERARADTPGPVRALELHRVRLPLVRAFRTARSTTTYKDALLVRAVTDDGAGWGECAAETTPGNRDTSRNAAMTSASLRERTGRTSLDERPG